MTAGLAIKYEQDEPPSYEKWLEWQWNDDSWWEWVLESEAEHLALNMGIDLDIKEISFDLYYRTCAGKGSVANFEKFAEFYYDRLSKISILLVELLRNGLIEFKWGLEARGMRVVSAYYDDYHTWSEDFEFTSGFFNGMNVQELFDAEANKSDEFETELVQIIKEVFEDILMVLTTEDETRTSTEEYEEWIKNSWIP